jgi:hypothetical protein
MDIVKEMKSTALKMEALAWLIQSRKNIDPTWERRALELQSAAVTLNGWAEAEEQLEKTIQIDEPDTAA